MRHRFRRPIYLLMRRPTILIIFLLEYAGRPADCRRISHEAFGGGNVNDLRSHEDQSRGLPKKNRLGSEERNPTGIGLGSEEEDLRSRRSSGPPWPPPLLRQNRKPVL
jgi:hypothetical protein